LVKVLIDVEGEEYLLSVDIAKEYSTPATWAPLAPGAGETEGYYLLSPFNFMVREPQSI